MHISLRNAIMLTASFLAGLFVVSLQVHLGEKSYAEIFIPPPHVEETNELISRGKKLALTINSLPSQLFLKEIDPILLKQQIPIGTTFRDAEIILRAAGLAVKITSDKPGKIYVVGMREKRSFLDATDTIIKLTPRIEDNLNSNIGAVSGSVTHTSL